MEFFEKAKAHWSAENVIQKTYQVCSSFSTPDELYKYKYQIYSQCLSMIQGIWEFGV